MNELENHTHNLSSQLFEIQQQLNELRSRLSEVQLIVKKNSESFNKQSTTIEGESKQNSKLSEQLSAIENNLSLVSDVVRYRPLRDMLAAEKWEEADKETTRLIADIAGHEDLEEFRPDQVQHFPCVHLQVIDNLWLNYSKERFGFSIQVRIYQEEGGNIETTIEQDSDIIRRWGKRLGWRAENRWRKCEELDWTLNAPIGCHPSRWWNSPFGSKMTNYFLARLINCELNSGNR
ncbi:GUN4 domain-containing protein [Mastigocoleus testarum]|uniref:GUN4-like domain-containing protein n=1 Tax=Mastigocoleus testarum BC008 TaxID=371196 RepID=A0A0V7ZMJ8_9CYAN|nr:GUN4 domain-containing protein [Mastigocoleus testarum]KST65704.1 hypothetical protein BC008_22255 [Mastigocoleus testarum BC008]